MSSTYGFALYTRDIVYYYNYAILRYDVGEKGSTKNERITALNHLIKSFDDAFPKVDLKTP